MYRDTLTEAFLIIDPCRGTEENAGSKASRHCAHGAAEKIRREIEKCRWEIYQRTERFESALPSEVITAFLRLS